jgi:hypothetical protein
MFLTSRMRKQEYNVFLVDYYSPTGDIIEFDKMNTLEDTIRKAKCLTTSLSISKSLQRSGKGRI